MKLGFAALLSEYDDRSDFTPIWHTDISLFRSALPNLRGPEIPKLTPMVRLKTAPTGPGENMRCLYHRLGAASVAGGLLQKTGEVENIAYHFKGRPAPNL